MYCGPYTFWWNCVRISLDQYDEWSHSSWKWSKANKTPPFIDRIELYCSTFFCCFHELQQQALTNNKKNSNYCLAHTNCERNGKQPKLTNDQQRLHFVFHQLCSHSNWMTSSLAKCIGNERNHHTHTHVNREEFNWASTKPELIRKHKHTHTYTWTQARYGVCSVHVSHGHSTPSRQNNRMNVERTVRISYSK